MAISGAVACSIISGSLFPAVGGSVAVAICAAVAAGVLCGLWNGFLVAKIKIQPIVATMILMVAGAGYRPADNVGQDHYGQFRRLLFH